jgi:ubiquinone/menaquinone biosynthesis C-methylase UbiE
MLQAVRKSSLDTYVIAGGRAGRARLGVIARALAETTDALLDRVGSISGGFCVDAACGGGDVSFQIAERVGPQGHVFGFDLDETKLAIARTEAKARGLYNATFRAADVLAPWPVRNARLVYARFILTHLADPGALLARAMQALGPGGVMVAEDIDIDGRFCDPPCPALERANELYKAVVRRNGGDPLIGRKLVRLFEAAGFRGVQATLVQPFGRDGDAKETARLTFSHTAPAMVAAGLATSREVEGLQCEIDAFTARPDSVISMPRIFQVWARLS